MATTRRTVKKKLTHRLINGGTTPVIYTDDGRVLAAGVWVEIEKIDATTSALIERGYVTLETEGDDDAGDQDEQDTPGESLPKSDS